MYLLPFAGSCMASALPGNVEEDRVSAMSAAMLSLGERISSELGRGTLEQVFIKGERGYVILTSVGEEAVLTVLARPEAQRLFETLREMTKDGLSIIFISHKLHEVMAASDRVAVLRGGKLVCFFSDK